MKTVLNKTHRPLKIHLSQGKVLHLGPGRKGQISARDEERESVKALVTAGEIEIVGDGSRPQAEGGAAYTGRPESHGHHPSTTVKKRGDR